MAFASFDTRRGSAPMTDINMVPLIDVMLVLLVIFIVTAPLLTHAVKLDLPKASAPVNQLKPDKIEFAIDAQGQRFYNGEPVTRAQAAERFAAGRPGAAAAGTAPARRPGRGLPRGGRNPGRRRRAGLTRIGFVSEPEPR
jgi:biopolymer transport protein ExbD